MIIFPAIDIFDKKAVRLYKGDYSQMTVYGNPVDIAKDFKNKGATHIHIVDLEGAKSGETPNFETVIAIKETSGLFCEIGGGIRSMDVIEKYINSGIDRVILGTAALCDEDLLINAVNKYKEKIAVGVDIRDGFVAIKGWTQKSETDAFSFCEKLQNIGVKTIICTDISKDGAMQGANHDLYRQLSEKFEMNIVASGGVSSYEDVEKLKYQGIYGAIIGKAYYTGAIDLEKIL
ncbi:MAG TPA: 1-(5-phosphoribosyl)-5-[(5-phosphoribosylamino)methylideneamino]imidazole-4-carboxamide isomerase [Clostridiales bacterium]|nr:1-(5-phosphoribosyl)-5-[(5-phosphoribosylamino)methylideneamino]imidazole-4-carboxamide isomerase [Clostridiales bacterium]